MSSRMVYFEMVFVTLVFTLFGSSLAGSTSEWGQAERDLALKVHNDYRRKEGGCQVNKLEYDMGLEEQAKSWANGCVFKHEMKKGRGENLAFNSNKKPESELIEHAAKKWMDEKNYYSYGQYTCGNSCHYTQMVWATTSKVGCYSTRCDYLTYGFPNSWYLVCFYTPGGNMNGEKPYQRRCDTPCLEGQTEEDGLCAGEATGEAACNDKLPKKCPGWAARNQCTSNPTYMENQCQKSCGLCTVSGSGSGSKGGNPDCKDKDPYQCPGWAERGECDDNPSYMLNNCKKSCEVC